MKVGLVCSHGGHLTETLQVLEAFEGQDIFFVTYHSSREAEVCALARSYFMDDIGWNPKRLVTAFVHAYGILQVERPDVIVSLGAEVALPFFVLAKLRGIKTIYIESWCRVDNLSLTGKLVYPLSDAFFVQWPALLQVVGEKAHYEGAVI